MREYEPSPKHLRALTEVAGAVFAVATLVGCGHAPTAAEYAQTDAVSASASSSLKPTPRVSTSESVSTVLPAQRSSSVVTKTAVNTISVPVTTNGKVSPKTYYYNTCSSGYTNDKVVSTQAILSDSRPGDVTTLDCKAGSLSTDKAYSWLYLILGSGRVTTMEAPSEITATLGGSGLEITNSKKQSLGTVSCKNKSAVISLPSAPPTPLNNTSSFCADGTISKDDVLQNVGLDQDPTVIAEAVSAIAARQSNGSKVYIVSFR